jgi:hypothetical protein
MSRTLQMSKPAGNTTWTMEMDPTKALLLSLTSVNATQITTHHSVSSEQYKSVPATLCSRLQQTMSNGCVSSIMADCTTSQKLCPPLPSSVQFDNNSDGENLLKPKVSLASCDMTLSMSTKQIKVLVTSCVKQQLFQRVKFFDDDLHGQFDHNPDSMSGMVRKYCLVSAIETNLNWWYEMRRKIKRTLGNHRNNCIQSMRSHFCGKLYQRLGQKQYIALLMLLVQMENMAR